MTEPSHQRDRQGWALRRLLDIHDGLRSDLVRLRAEHRALTGLPDRTPHFAKGMIQEVTIT